MSFNRKHIERFVASLDCTRAEAEAINKRAEEAAAQFGSTTGDFSGSKLREVLGSDELLSKFDHVWTNHRGALDPV